MENNLIKIINYIVENQPDYMSLTMFCINENLLETLRDFQNIIIELLEENKVD